MLTDLLRAIRLPKKVQDEPSPKLILTWAYGVIASSSGSSCPWLDALSSIDKLTSLSLSGRVSCCPCSDSTSSIQTYCLSIYRWDEPRLSQPFCPGITHHPHEQPFSSKSCQSSNSTLYYTVKGVVIFLEVASISFSRISIGSKQKSTYLNRPLIIRSWLAYIPVFRQKAGEMSPIGTECLQ